MAKRIVESWQSMTPTHQSALCGAWESETLCELMSKLVDDPHEFTEWILNPIYTIKCRIITSSSMANPDCLVAKELMFPENKDDMTIFQLKSRISLVMNCKEEDISMTEPDQATFGELNMRAKHALLVKIDI